VITAVISLLHEPAGARNSAARMFRERPVLAWTLDRLSRAHRIDEVAVLCWDDQADAVNEIAADAAVHVVVKSPRVRIPSIEQVSAAQRWSDGWRGGLLGTCYFDRGFCGAFVVEVVEGLAERRHSHARSEDVGESEGNGGGRGHGTLVAAEIKKEASGSGDLILLVDPSSALVDAELIDALIDHADSHPHRELFFTQAAPGLSGVVLRPALLDRLAKSNAHPGRILAYSPDLPGLDPVTNDMCIPVLPAVARTAHRLLLDSDRQIRRFTSATADLNGHLIASDAEKLIAILDAYPQRDSHPRELVLELTTARSTRPIYAPTTHLNLSRGEMPLEAIAKVIDEARGIDDLRLTLAGAGDPLLHSQFTEILQLIAQAKIPAVHLETDLFEIPEAAMAALVNSQIDIITLHLPAITAATYHRVMGVDGYAKVIENLKKLLAKKQTPPLIVPTFTKCRENLSEMETWYDHWIRLLGAAVITAPTDYAGQIPDAGVADMSPPGRRPCARLKSRMTILSDARIVSCEQDFLGRQTMGCAKSGRLATVWSGNLAQLSDEHARNNLNDRPVCAACKEWHRP